MRISSPRASVGDRLRRSVCGARLPLFSGRMKHSAAWPMAIVLWTATAGCSIEYKDAPPVASNASHPTGGGDDAPASSAASTAANPVSPPSAESPLKVDNPTIANPQLGPKTSAGADTAEALPQSTPAATKSPPNATDVASGGDPTGTRSVRPGADSPAPAGNTPIPPASAAGSSPAAHGTNTPPVAKRLPPKRDLLPIESTSRRAVVRENGLEVITFDDLILGMQPDMVFRDFLLTDRARELDGKKVRLVGYMDGGVSQTKGIQEFVLLQNTECKFGPGGQADHLVRVLMKGGATADYTLNALQVEGVLKINPYNGPDGNTWSVYDLIGEQVKTIRKK